MENKIIVEELKKSFPNDIQKVTTSFGDTSIEIKKDALLPVVVFLKKPPFEMTMLLDLTCVDFPQRKNRFEMVYHLFSLKHNTRLRIKVGLKGEEPEIDSLTSLWKNANWLEREVYDMYGVRFSGHPDLRRIFMYEGFEGYPLRKDYPLRKRQPRIPLK